MLGSCHSSDKSASSTQFTLLLEEIIQITTVLEYILTLQYTYSAPKEEGTEAEAGGEAGIRRAHGEKTLELDVSRHLFPG